MSIWPPQCFGSPGIFLFLDKRERKAILAFFDLLGKTRELCFCRAKWFLRFYDRFWFQVEKHARIVKPVSSQFTKLARIYSMIGCRCGNKNLTVAPRRFVFEIEHVLGGGELLYATLEGQVKFVHSTIANQALFNELRKT
jgi:hypothetical protein